jgi:serine/threonine protein kinase
MADVYYAFDRVRSTHMAVKVLRRDLAARRDLRHSFEEEAKILGKLQHPNIVRFYEIKSHEDITFIVMDWVNGGNLRQRIDAWNRVFTLREVLQILEPVCKALSFSHNMEYFHCDIKPSNIMLHENGKDVFLTDFGVARLAADKKGGGTPPYMAPEQFSGHVSAQTDIYSLGVAVYEMLSGGRLPFHGDAKSPGSTTRERYEWEHKNLTFPPLSQFNRNLPGDVFATVDKALEKNPRNRFSTAVTFYETFMKAVDSSTVIDLSPPPSTPIPPAPSPVPRPGHELKPGTKYLIGRSGEKTGEMIPLLRQEVIIGRGNNSYLRLQERSVSRIHAAILLTKRGTYVKDVNSLLGTYVNGQRIPPGVPIKLNNGDVIETGHGQIFEYQVG